MIMPMTVTVRSARPGDGAGISRAWLSAGAYYANLDPEYFQVPRTEGLAERSDNQLGRNRRSCGDIGQVSVASSHDLYLPESAP